MSSRASGRWPGRCRPCARQRRHRQQPPRLARPCEMKRGMRRASRPRRSLCWIHALCVNTPHCWETQGYKLWVGIGASSQERRDTFGPTRQGNNQMWGACLGGGAPAGGHCNQLCFACCEGPAAGVASFAAHTPTKMATGVIHKNIARGGMGQDCPPSAGVRGWHAAYQISINATKNMA